MPAPLIKSPRDCRPEGLFRLCGLDLGRGLVDLPADRSQLLVLVIPLSPRQQFSPRPLHDLITQLAVGHCMDDAGVGPCLRRG